MTLHYSIAKQFTKFTGLRFRKLGKFSGEEFREDHLVGLLKRDPQLIIDLDGGRGYGSSFLEEAFGGLLRRKDPFSADIVKGIKFISEEDPTLIKEIEDYIDKAVADNQPGRANR